MARPRVEINQKVLNELVEDVVGEVLIDTEEEAELLGRAMLAEVVRIVQAVLPTTDHKLNTTHLDKSFTYFVERDGDGWNVGLSIKPGVSSGKIYALNYGRSGSSKNYVILPRNVPRALEFSGPGTDYSVAQEKGKYAGRVLKPYAERESAGAVKGYGFLEEARENVLREFGYL